MHVPISDCESGDISAPWKHEGVAMGMPDRSCPFVRNSGPGDGMQDEMILKGVTCGLYKSGVCCRESTHLLDMRSTGRCAQCRLAKGCRSQGPMLQTHKPLMNCLRCRLRGTVERILCLVISFDAHVQATKMFQTSYLCYLCLWQGKPAI